MIKVVNMHEAKTSLSRLVEQARAGDEIILAKAGRPMVRLVPVMQPSRRKLGRWAGKVEMTEDFDDALPDAALAAWEGRG